MVSDSGSQCISEGEESTRQGYATRAAEQGCIQCGIIAHPRLTAMSPKSCSFCADSCSGRHQCERLKALVVGTETCGSREATLTMNLTAAAWEPRSTVSLQQRQASGLGLPAALISMLDRRSGSIISYETACAHATVAVWPGVAQPLQALVVWMRREAGVDNPQALLRSASVHCLQTRTHNAL